MSSRLTALTCLAFAVVAQSTPTSEESPAQTAYREYYAARTGLRRFVTDGSALSTQLLTDHGEFKGEFGAWHGSVHTGLGEFREVWKDEATAIVMAAPFKPDGISHLAWRLAVLTLSDDGRWRVSCDVPIPDALQAMVADASSSVVIDSERLRPIVEESARQTLRDSTSEDTEWVHAIAELPTIRVVLESKAGAVVLASGEESMTAVRNPQGMFIGDIHFLGLLRRDDDDWSMAQMIRL